MYKINENAKRKMYKIFNTNEKMIEDDVTIVKNWLNTQPHLPEIMDDVPIRNFLNLNKFSIEKTKQKIDMYYTIRSLVPEMFDRSNPKLGYLKKMINSTYFTTMPTKVDGLHTVYFIKQKLPDTLEAVDWTNLWYALYEIRLHEDFMVNDILVFDFTTMSINNLTKLTPSFMRKFFTVYQKVYSLRIKSVIIVNFPQFISFFAQVLKLVMKQKLFNRVQFYPDASVLKDLLPQECIPKDYGGEGPSLDKLNEILEKKIHQYQFRFDNLDILKINETRRPQKLDNDEILGFYGSFKQIDVD